MKNLVILKDGTEVTIRPMKKDDLEKSFSFFRSLPDRDRTYLRADVSRREVVKRRIDRMRTGTVKRLVALAGGRIVADGALEWTGEDWKEHVGELRLIVASQFKRKGLGTTMARELYTLAAREKVDEIVVKMMRPQKAARSIFRKLGFRQETMLPEYVKDLRGKKQDLIVMRCNLEDLLQELKQDMAESDWGRTR